MVEESCNRMTQDAAAQQAAKLFCRAVTHARAAAGSDNDGAEAAGGRICIRVGPHVPVISKGQPKVYANSGRNGRCKAWRPVSDLWSCHDCQVKGLEVLP
jgi:hypothetical protein